MQKFLLKSLMSSLISLTDENYHDIFEAENDDVILIDYFAPVIFQT